MAKINGTWYFNSEFGAVEFDQAVNFTSNGQTFDRMACLTDTSTLTNAPHLYYYSGDTAVLAGEGYVFTNTAYQTVEFGESSQEVSMTYLYFMDTSGYAQNGCPALNGIWRFKEAISFDVSCSAGLSFITRVYDNCTEIQFDRSVASSDSSEYVYGIKYTQFVDDALGGVHNTYQVYSSANGWTRETDRYAIFTNEQEVPHLFYAVFTANADDVTDIMTSVVYDGKPIGALRVGYGDKLTIPCADLVMKSDISILGSTSTPIPTTEEVAVIPSKSVQEITPTNADYISKVTVEAIPDKYFSPSGTRTVVTNGQTLDVRAYAYVDVQVKKPLEIATEAEMTALLESAEVGSVYKYTGESTDTYENGALYIVEAVTE